MKGLTPYFLAIISGTLLGVSSPAIDLWPLGFIALIPFYYAIEKSHSYRNTVILGFIVGTIATGITTWPLTSASTWVGWAEFTREESSSHQATYQSSLIMIWASLSLIGGGVLFSIFSGCFKWFLSKRGILTLLVSAPILWLLIIESGRNFLFFDYQWMPIGSLFINIPWLAQLAAYGGVWLLGALVVFINGLIYLILFKRNPIGRRFKWGIIGIFVLSIFTALGFNRYNTVNNINDKKPINVSTIQFSKDFYTEKDYTPFYMDKHYLRLLKSAYEKFSDKIDILVLPESIGFGNVSLDGTKSKNTPDKTVSTIQNWHEAITPLILKSSLLIFGVDTVTKTKDYNSIVVWNKTGPIWKYDKQRLVPFAESIPDNLKFLGPEGKSTYSSGTQIGNLKANRAEIGFFICQEVLFSDIINKSTLAGAEFLVTVGNDGVFANTKVAENNHISAQFRAIESGRYIVRAMKNGVSSIITPTGNDRVSIKSKQNGLISSKVFPRTEITLYTKFHDYVLWILLGTGLFLFIVTIRIQKQNR